ncbi:MAG: sulfotransferase domain-containing protein [Candidatus Thiodiazotropha sp.]
MQRSQNYNVLLFFSSRLLGKLLSFILSVGILYQNPIDAVRQVAQFLNKDLSEGIIEDIADKCSFKNLKEAEERLKQETDVVQKKLTDAEEEKKTNLGPPSVYRKGIYNSYLYTLSLFN